MVTKSSNLENLLESLFSEEENVDEMAISTFKTVGDWGKKSSFKHDVDRRLLTSPKAVEKIHKQWEKTPYDFDMYLVNDPRVNKSEFREVGLVDMSFVRDKMKLTPEEIPDPSGDTIVIIYTGNFGDERYMASGWILAHRLGHALARGRGTPAQMWNEFTNTLRKRIANMLKEVYGIDVYSSTYDFANNAQKDKMLKYVAQQLGTMKSARDENLRNWYEFAYELLAQYLITGKIKFNPLPKSLVTGIAGWGRKETRWVRDEEVRTSINESDIESFAEEMEYELEGILGASVGRVFVM